MSYTISIERNFSEYHSIPKMETMLQDRFHQNASRWLSLSN